MGKSDAFKLLQSIAECTETIRTIFEKYAIVSEEYTIAVMDILDPKRYV